MDACPYIFLMKLLKKLHHSKIAGEDGEVTTTHLLLGIWSEKDSAGYKIMTSLGFDDEKAKELAKSVSSGP